MGLGLGRSQVSAAGNGLLNNLVAYWKLDEAGGDRSDAHASYTLTDNNTVGSTTGKINNAAVFVAAQSESLSNTAAIFDPGLGSFTVNTWCYITAVSETEYLATKGNRISGVAGWSIFLSTVSGICVRCGAGGVVQRASQTHALPADGWHMVTLVINRTTNIVLGYLDGSNTGWTDGGGGPTTNSLVGMGTISKSDPLYLGRSSISTGNYLNRALDEVSVWSVALSDADISVLYNGGAGLPYSQFTT